MFHVSLKGLGKDRLAVSSCLPLRGAVVENDRPSVVGWIIAESVSVIGQVWVFKAIKKGPNGQGRRLFRMAPLHHHFEL